MTYLTHLLAQDEPQGSGLLSLLIILIPLGLVIYMTIIPQRKQRQKQQQLLAKLEVGDEVLTNAGIIGTITFVEDDIYHIEIDTDVVIRVVKTAVVRSTEEPEEEAAASRTRGKLEAGDSDDDASEDESKGER